MRYAYSEPMLATSAEIAKNFGLWQARALSAPVVITNHGRPRTVMISADHYARWTEVDTDEGATKSLVFETSFAAVLDNCFDGFISFDANLQVTALNRVVEALIGRARVQAIGQDCASLFPADTATVFAEQLRRVIRTGQQIDFSMDVVDESTRSYLVRAFPYPSGVAILLQNKTRERNVEAASGRHLALEAALSATSAVTIATLSLRAGIESVDADFEKFTGMASNRVAGFRLPDLVAIGDRRRLHRLIDDVIGGANATSIETALMTSDGEERPVQIGISAVLRDAVPCGLIATIVKRVAEPA